MRKLILSSCFLSLLWSCQKEISDSTVGPDPCQIEEIYLNINDLENGVPVVLKDTISVFYEDKKMTRMEIHSLGDIVFHYQDTLVVKAVFFTDHLNPATELGYILISYQEGDKIARIEDHFKNGSTYELGHLLTFTLGSNNQPQSSNTTEYFVGPDVNYEISYTYDDSLNIKGYNSYQVENSYYRETFFTYNNSKNRLYKSAPSLFWFHLAYTWHYNEEWISPLLFSTNELIRIYDDNQNEVKFEYVYDNSTGRLTSYVEDDDDVNQKVTYSFLYNCP